MGPVAGVAIVVLVFDLTGLNCKIGSSGKKLIKFPLKLDLKFYLGLNCKVGSFAKKLIKFHLKLDLKWYFVTKTVLTYWERNVLRSLVQFLKQNAFLIISQKHQNNQNSNGKKMYLETYRKKIQKRNSLCGKMRFLFGVQVPRDIGQTKLRKDYIRNFQIYAFGSHV